MSFLMMVNMFKCYLKAGLRREKIIFLICSLPCFYSLSDAKKEITSLSKAGESLEKQRSELMTRMKLMMQQHWQDTVSILNNDEDFRDNNKVHANYLPVCTDVSIFY